MKTILSTVRGWVVIGVILGSGGAWGQEVCTIPGNDGRCKVVAFIRAEKSNDKDAKTCRKFTKIEYQGTCLNGFLNGVALLKRVETKTTSHFIGKFEQGLAAEPILEYSEYYIALTSPTLSNACVNYGRIGSNVKWDNRTTNSDCLRASQIFGNEYLSDETFKAINNGTFRLAGQPQSGKPSNNSNGVDDPKVFGRSARGG